MARASWGRAIRASGCVAAAGRRASGCVAAAGRRARALVMLAVLAAAGPPPPAALAAPREHEVKAAFLYNFAKFAEWPETAFPDRRAPLTMCVLGYDRVGDALASLQGRTVAGRTLQVRTLAATPGAGESAKECRVLFVPAAQGDRLPALLPELADQPVLTVGERPGFAQRGGIINLITVGDKLRFEINPDAARRAGVRLSSHLLRLARIVETRQ